MEARPHHNTSPPSRYRRRSCASCRCTPSPRSTAKPACGNGSPSNSTGSRQALAASSHQAGIDRTRQYVDHLTTTLADQPWARVIKLSDFTDNGVGIIHTIGPKVQHFARKYTSAVPVLRDLLDRPDTPLDPSIKDHIHRQLDLAQERFTAILAA